MYDIYILFLFISRDYHKAACYPLLTSPNCRQSRYRTFITYWRVNIRASLPMEWPPSVFLLLQNLYTRILIQIIHMLDAFFMKGKLYLQHVAIKKHDSNCFCLVKVAPTFCNVKEQINKKVNRKNIQVNRYF